MFQPTDRDTVTSRTTNSSDQIAAERHSRRLGTVALPNSPGTRCSNQLTATPLLYEPLKIRPNRSRTTFAATGDSRPPQLPGHSMFQPTDRDTVTSRTTKPSDQIAAERHSRRLRTVALPNSPGTQCSNQLTATPLPHEPLNIRPNRGATCAEHVRPSSAAVIDEAESLPIQCVNQRFKKSPLLNH